MEIAVERVQGRVPITVLRIIGDLDGSNYEQLIQVAEQEYAAGARDFLIDLGETSYISSAGLVALHMIVKLSRGERERDTTGWEALHAIGREEGKGAEVHVKLLNPQPRVSKVLEIAGMKTFLPMFQDRGTAIASF
jgi:anti-anti-sigma factor